MGYMIFSRVGVVILCLCFFTPRLAHAANLDIDGDGLQDVWEIQLFHTDSLKADTDGDGFSDGTEVRAGFDPLNAKAGVRLTLQDTDGDTLADAQEVALGSDPLVADSDGDGYADGTEVKNAYSPVNAKPVLLTKSILVDLSEQKLYQKVDGVVIGTHVISSGKASTPTPLGTYKVLNKSPRAWSRSAKLWMPFWMAFKTGGYGLHELPEWPNGIKEGAKHLGIPVSHGCIRLGVGAAKTLYEWTPIGTPITIQK